MCLSVRRHKIFAQLERSEHFFRRISDRLRGARNSREAAPSQRASASQSNALISRRERSAKRKAQSGFGIRRNAGSSKRSERTPTRTQTVGGVTSSRPGPIFQLGTCKLQPHITSVLPSASRLTAALKKKGEFNIRPSRKR